MDSNAPSETPSNLQPRQFLDRKIPGKTVLHGGLQAASALAVGGLVVAGALSHPVYDQSFHAPESGQAHVYGQAQYEHALHHVEQSTGLHCQPKARPGVFPESVVQHRMVNDTNQYQGSGSMRTYNFAQASKGSDLDHNGKNATRWSDAFCY